MSADYCDRSTELFRCAQLLHQKVVAGRVALKPRISQPGAVDAYFAPTLLRSQFLPLIKQASTSLTLGKAKMDQLDALTNRYISAVPRDTQLALSIASLAQKLQPEVVAVSGFLQKLVSLSTQVLQEFSGHLQVCRHVRSLVSSQEFRLAELSMRLRDFMEANREIMTIAAEKDEPPVMQFEAPKASAIPRPPSARHLQKTVPFEEPLRVSVEVINPESSLQPIYSFIVL